jgi:hypothetical protein
MSDINKEDFDIPFEQLQPWSTFVLKTILPPPILEKMIRITDEIVENRTGKGVNNDEPGAGQIEDQFWIESEILKREELLGFFLEVCRIYVVQSFCQLKPFNKEHIINEEWETRIMDRMWINSQKDHEYFPIHTHIKSDISATMYLKIPEYLPSRRSYHRQIEGFDPTSASIAGEDGAISFTNNSSNDQIWGNPTLQLHPKVGDFFIFPASQEHQVYPFRTLDGKGERRSVSFNAAFTSKSEQDNLKKQQEKYYYGKSL